MLLEYFSQQSVTAVPGLTPSASALAAPVKATGKLCPVSTLAQSLAGGAGVLCPASKLRKEASTPTRPHGLRVGAFRELYAPSGTVASALRTLA